MNRGLTRFLFIWLTKLIYSFFNMLSIKKYAFLCVLGTEVFYVLCSVYGQLLSAKGQALHNALFELIPWFTWGNIGSMVWGAVFLGVISSIVGSYIAWMHNASYIGERK